MVFNHPQVHDEFHLNTLSISKLTTFQYLYRYKNKKTKNTKNRPQKFPKLNSTRASQNLHLYTQTQTQTYTYIYIYTKNLVEKDEKNAHNLYVNNKRSNRAQLTRNKIHQRPMWRVHIVDIYFYSPVVLLYCYCSIYIQHEKFIKCIFLSRHCSQIEPRKISFNAIQSKAACKRHQMWFGVLLLLFWFFKYIFVYTHIITIQSTITRLNRFQMKEWEP